MVASIAAYTLIDGWAVKTLAISPLVYYVIGLALRTILLAPAALRTPASLPNQWQMHRVYIVVVGVPDAAAFCAALDREALKMYAVGPQRVRAVTHLDVDRAGIERAIAAARAAMA